MQFAYLKLSSIKCQPAGKPLLEHFVIRWEVIPAETQLFPHSLLRILQQLQLVVQEGKPMYNVYEV